MVNILELDCNWCFIFVVIGLSIWNLLLQIFPHSGKWATPTLQHLKHLPGPVHSAVDFLLNIAIFCKSRLITAQWVPLCGVTFLPQLFHFCWILRPECMHQISTYLAIVAKLFAWFAFWINGPIKCYNFQWFLEASRGCQVLWLITVCIMSTLSNAFTRASHISIL